MAVIGVDEHVDGRGGSDDDTRNREYTRTFLAYVSLRTDGPEVILRDPRIPRLWDPYVPASGVPDLGSWCRNRDAQPTPDPLTWKVVCKYNSKLERPDVNQIEDPLMRPAEISWSTTRVAVPATHAEDGRMIKNSAGDPFDPPPEIDEKRLVMKIARNQAGYDALLYQDFIDSVNEEPFFGFKKKAVKCADISGSRSFENGILYWKASFQFEIKPERIPDGAKLQTAGFKPDKDTSQAWVRWFLDRGFRQKVSGKLKLMLDTITKQPLSAPGLLDGSGVQLAVGGNPVFRGYELYPAKDFRLLNLA